MSNIKLVIKTNPDKEIVRAIRERLKYTNGYCPCVPDTLWNEDTKCICKEFREKQEPGFCHCSLYYKDLEYSEIQRNPVTLEAFSSRQGDGDVNE